MNAGLAFGARGRCGLKSGAVSLVFVLSLASADARAAGLQGLTGSITLLAVLLALLVASWPLPMSASSWAVPGLALFVASGLVMGWRVNRRAGSASLRRRGEAGGACTTASAGALAEAAPRELPGGFRSDRLLDAARQHFVRLQAAWDAGDLVALRELTTPFMFEEVTSQLPQRGPGPNRTDVLTLQAELLGFEQVGALYVANVQFSGMLRESAERGAVPFRELWMLAWSKDDAQPGWRLARQQALW